MANGTQTAQGKLDWITDHLGQGKRVYICTHTRITRVTPRWFDRIGDLFKVSGDSLYMARGRSWDCIDYCGIRADP